MCVCVCVCLVVIAKLTEVGYGAGDEEDGVLFDELADDMDDGIDEAIEEVMLNSYTVSIIQCYSPHTHTHTHTRCDLIQQM